MKHANRKPIINAIIATLVYNTLISLLLLMLVDKSFIALLFISHSIGLSILASNLLIYDRNYSQEIRKVVGYSLIGFAVGVVIAFIGHQLIFDTSLAFSVIGSGLFFTTIALLIAWLYFNRLESQEMLDKIKQKLTHAGDNERLFWIKASDAKGVVFLIHVKDVKYFQAQQKYTSIYTQDGEYLINTPVKQLLTQLDENYFWAIHRATIVNLQFINKVSKNEQDKLTVYLDDGTELSVSRNHASLFKKM